MIFKLIGKSEHETEKKRNQYNIKEYAIPYNIYECLSNEWVCNEWATVSKPKDSMQACINNSKAPCKSLLHCRDSMTKAILCLHIKSMTTENTQYDLVSCSILSGSLHHQQ